eukprot:648091-Rhodomonas_salina.1
MGRLALSLLWMAIKYGSSILVYSNTAEEHLAHWHDRGPVFRVSSLRGTDPQGSLQNRGGTELACAQNCIALPLTDMLKSTKFQEKYGVAYKKQAPVTLGEREVKAFEALKEALINSPCLIIFDPSKPTEVWADASRSHYTVGPGGERKVLLLVHGYAARRS